MGLNLGLTGELDNSASDLRIDNKDFAAITVLHCLIIHRPSSPRTFGQISSPLTDVR